MSEPATGPAGKFAYSHPLQVCLRDLDGLGHVNNAVYMTYLETARNRYVFDLTDRTRVGEFDFILARTEIDFRAAAELHDELLVHLRPIRIGTSSWDLEYEIRDRGRDTLLVAARSVQVSYNYAAERSMPVPEDFRRILEAEMHRCGAGRA